MPLYKLPDLPYDYSALEPHLSGEILELHHGKHHKAYVDGANTTFEKLGEARSSGDFGTINQLEKNMAFHLSGHVLHSLFWQNLGPDAGGEPSGELAEQLGTDFGDFSSFKKQMIETATSIQGSGWAVAAWDSMSQRVLTFQVHDHQGEHGQGTLPLLVIDAWEHAWYLQYKNVKADYFDAVWNVVNWDDVAGKLKEAQATKWSP